MSRWPLSRAIIIHRIGRLMAGEQIVFVGCAFPTVMPLLKQRAS